MHMRWLCLLVLAMTVVGCSRSNNLLFGRVEAQTGKHVVVVTDCYRIRVPQPERLADVRGERVYRFAPCRDAQVFFRGHELIVNGTSYGEVASRDAITVDHGKVLVNDRPAVAAGSGTRSANRPSGQFNAGPSSSR